MSFFRHTCENQKCQAVLEVPKGEDDMIFVQCAVCKQKQWAFANPQNKEGTEQAPQETQQQPVPEQGPFRHTCESCHCQLDVPSPHDRVKVKCGACHAVQIAVRKPAAQTPVPMQQQQQLQQQPMQQQQQQPMQQPTQQQGQIPQQMQMQSMPQQQYNQTYNQPQVQQQMLTQQHQTGMHPGQDMQSQSSTSMQHQGAQQQPMQMQQPGMTGGITLNSNAGSMMQGVKRKREDGMPELDDPTGVMNNANQQTQQMQQQQYVTQMPPARPAPEPELSPAEIQARQSRHIDAALAEKFFLVAAKIQPGGESTMEFTVIDGKDDYAEVEIGPKHACSCAFAKQPQGSVPLLCKHMLFCIHRILMVPRDSELLTKKGFDTQEALDRLTSAPTMPTHSKKKKTEVSAGEAKEQRLCPLCYDGMDTAEVTTCERHGCIMHKSCFEIWKQRCQFKGLPITCTLCGILWEDAEMAKSVADQTSPFEPNLEDLADLGPFLASWMKQEEASLSKRQVV